MDSMKLTGPSGLQTTFTSDGTRICLEQLCGLPCAKITDDALAFVVLVELATDTGRFAPADYQLVEATADSGRVCIAWRVGEEGLRWESVWSICAKTGVISRKDMLHNRCDKPVVVRRCRSRFVFPARAVGGLCPAESLVQ